MNLESQEEPSNVFDDGSTWPRKLQYVNLIAYIVMALANNASMKYSKFTNKQVADQWNLRLTPAGWAFAIWGIIYTLLLVFAIYQFFSPAYLGSQELIFNVIGNTFWVNCLLNSGWLFTFQFNNLNAFVVSTVIIVAMWWTTFVMMDQSTRYELNRVEVISMRIGFSLYCGWLTTATILNFIFIFEASKKQREQMQDDEYQKYSELENSTYSIIILYFAMCVYLAIMTYEKNPVFGIVFVWALKAIKSKQEQYKSLLKHIGIIAHVYLIYLLAFTGYLVYEYWKGNTTYGLFY